MNKEQLYKCPLNLNKVRLDHYFYQLIIRNKKVLFRNPEKFRYLNRENVLIKTLEISLYKYYLTKVVLID